MSFLSFASLLGFSFSAMALCVWVIIRGIRKEAKLEEENKALHLKVIQDGKTMHIFAKPNRTKPDIVKRMREKAGDE
jgi:hypothetical protein